MPSQIFYIFWASDLLSKMLSISTSQLSHTLACAHGLLPIGPSFSPHNGDGESACLVDFFIYISVLCLALRRCSVSSSYTILTSGMGDSWIVSVETSSSGAASHSWRFARAEENSQGPWQIPRAGGPVGGTAPFHLGIRQLPGSKTKGLCKKKERKKGSRTSNASHKHCFDGLNINESKTHGLNFSRRA